MYAKLASDSFSKGQKWDGQTGLFEFLRSSTRAFARVARYSPGYHIAGFQPCLHGAFVPQVVPNGRRRNKEYAVKV